MITVSVLIPTFRRPDSLVRAVRSVFAQRGVAGIEVIAVDNSPEGSALAAFRAIEAEAPVTFRWVHEPKPGVAQARNAAVKLAKGEFVAWLDDDEEASPDWLACLIAVRRATGAQSVFGPVRARADRDARNAEFYERLYTRAGPANDTGIAHAYGIGNSLQPRSMFEEEDATFDTRADQRGGEDDALFASWAEAGATFAWAAGASVVEHLGAERTHLAHGLKRAFAYGQGPCELAWAARDVPALARHMCVGAVQALAYGAASVIVVAGSTPRALALLDRAARGAGKVFWFCEQRFYGEAAIRQPA
ncbi:MAG: glycosyltransferase family 2 protein [Hyphomonadaceae bacterium]|nr:glycosyltransferase family 2 protein [Hyphomonadaceae bacterium]